MDRFLNKLADAKQHLAEPSWNEARARAVLAQVHKSRSPRRRSAPWLPFLLGPAVAGVLVWLAFVAKNPEAPATIVMRDGSRALPLGANTRLHLVQDEPAATLLDLEQGHSRFEVVPNRSRRFKVLSGNYSVEALGTVFTVNRLPAGGVHVAVLIGHVMVSWPGGQHEMWQGQEQRYPLAASPPADPVVKEEAPTQALTDETSRVDAVPAPARASSNRTDWRRLARQKSFARAFDVMRASGPQGVKDVPQELLLAADVARRAGHPEVATQHLQRILQAHRKDPRASVAAFTLGRVYAQQGEATAAAETFETAFALQPTGALAQDALAKAVFAWKASGQAERMRTAASKYLRHFPKGHQVEAVNQLMSTP